MRFLHAVVAGLLVAAPVVTSLAPAPAHAEEDKAALKKKLKALEKENAKLRDELAKKQAESRKAFEDATRAEKSAGLVFPRSTAVASSAVAETTPPVGQPATRHAFARLDHAELELLATFTTPRTIKTWRVYGMSCELKKKNR